MEGKRGKRKREMERDTDPLTAGSLLTKSECWAWLKPGASSGLPLGCKQKGYFPLLSPGVLAGIWIGNGIIGTQTSMHIGAGSSIS